MSSNCQMTSPRDHGLPYDVECPNCGELMAKMHRTRHGYRTRMFATAVFGLGSLLLWYLSVPIELTIGGLAITAGVFLASRRVKVWQCTKCDK